MLRSLSAKSGCRDCQKRDRIPEVESSLPPLNEQDILDEKLKAKFKTIKKKNLEGLLIKKFPFPEKKF